MEQFLSQKPDHHTKSLQGDVALLIFVCFCKESLELCFCSWAAGGPGGSQHQPILKANYPSPEGYQGRKTHSAQRMQTLSAPRAGSGAGSLTASSSWAPEPAPCARLGSLGTAAGRDSSSCSQDCSGMEKGCLCAPSFAAGLLGPGVTTLHFEITHSLPTPAPRPPSTLPGSQTCPKPPNSSHQQNHRVLPHSDLSHCSAKAWIQPLGQDAQGPHARLAPVTT